MSDFIREIEKFPSVKYLYRREPKEYTERMASAFRYYEGKFNDTKEYPFTLMLDGFYRETSPVLIDVEHDNFVAFAQHHGVPIPLTDLTKSPLVALYFACQKSEDTDGYIYLFDDCHIDITKILHKYPNKNLIEELFIKKNDDYLSLFPLLEQYYKKYPEELKSNLLKLFDDYKYCFNTTLDKKVLRVNC